MSEHRWRKEKPSGYDRTGTDYVKSKEKSRHKLMKGIAGEAFSDNFFSLW